MLTRYLEGKVISASAAPLLGHFPPPCLVCDVTQYVSVIPQNWQDVKLKPVTQLKNIIHCPAGIIHAVSPNFTLRSNNLNIFAFMRNSLDFRCEECRVCRDSPLCSCFLFCKLIVTKVFRAEEKNKNHLSGSNLKSSLPSLPRVKINELIGSCCFSDCSQGYCHCHNQKYGQIKTFWFEKILILKQ